MKKKFIILLKMLYLFTIMIFFQSKFTLEWFKIK